MSDKIRLPGIMSRQIQTERLNTHILTSGPPAGTAVLFIHGIAVSAGVWDETMLALPDGYHGIAPDLRGSGTSESLPVDATLGLDDFVADLRALIESLGLCPFHIVGHGIGGGVVMKYAIAYPQQLLSMTLVNTISPYGFGGTMGESGSLIHQDGAPAGAANVNSKFVNLLSNHIGIEDDPMSPQNVLRRFFVKPPFIAEREEMLLEAMLSTAVGEDTYPGNAVVSEHWPGAAPGEKGLVNACSGKYFNSSALVDIDDKPPILWIRGVDDLIVADNSLWDIAALGLMGYASGWPGEAECPPQPMLRQTRAVLVEYAARGGSFREVVIEDSGHLPFIEKPEEFSASLHAHIRAYDQDI